MIKKILVGIAGGTVLLVGIVMIILPGPAIIVIPAGIAILATEYAWARHYKEKIEAKCQAIRNRCRKSV